MTNASDSTSKAPGKKDSPAGDASVDGADAGESGYRRDDSWREESNEATTSDDVPEPENGYAFQSPEEKAKAGDGGTPDEGTAPENDPGSREQGNAGGEDDARIVED